MPHLPEPAQFADAWIAAWNAHDVEAVLRHYTDAVVFTSPVALRVVPESGGMVRGKDALRRYWVTALEGNPDLQFDLIDAYAGVDTIVLHYRNQVGAAINEVLTFRDGRIVAGHATHVHAETTAKMIFEPAGLIRENPEN